MNRRWRVGHAHGGGDVDEGGVDGADARVGVAQDGKQRVAGEGEDGEAGGVLAEPRDGQQKAEERERRDDLDDVSDGDDGLREALVAGEQDAERQADGDGEQKREAGEPEMLEGEAADFGGVEFEEAGHRRTAAT